MGRQLGQDNEHVTYGFGGSGIMSMELFPLFMGAYCLLIIIALAVAGWKLRGFLVKDRKRIEIVESSEFEDSNDNFDNSPEREGRSRVRKLHTRQRKRLLLQAKKQKQESETDSSSQED